VEKLSKPSWKKKSNDAWVTDLGRNQAEILVLRLSREEARKLRSSRRAAKSYLERHKFFKAKLNAVAVGRFPPVASKSAKQAKAGSASASVEFIILHSPNSAVLMVPVPKVP